MVIDIIFILLVAFLLLLNVLYRNMAKTIKEIPNGNHLSGFEIARKLSSHICESEPHIIKKRGKFLDHYNKDRNVIKLSPEVFDGEDIYAATVAINTTLEADKKRKYIPTFRKLNAFLVIISYVFIIAGACMNHILAMRLGFILFILAFIIEFALLSKIWGKEEDLNELYKYIKKEKLIKPPEEYQDKCIILALSRLATLPYSFINYFR